MDPEFPSSNDNEDRKIHDVDRRDNTSSSAGNLQSSDSGVSLTSEFSSGGSGDDSDGNVTAENESQNRKELSVDLLKNFLSWTQNSSVNLSRNAPTCAIDKIGGTLALIQYPRPPNLPMKSPVEEKRHRKQYNAILEEARKREIREECERRREREERIRREERLAIDSSVWHTEILPNFENLRRTRKVRRLWWCGLPPSIRGKIWILGIRNELNIKEEQYELYAKRISSNPSNETLDAIRLDVSRTLSNLGVFQEGGPLHEALRSVLASYAIYRSDIGYVQGMSFIGAVLTLNMEPNDAFVCFANLLNNPCHRAAFTLNQKQMNVYYEVFRSALERKISKVHAHFRTIGLSPDFYLLDWLYTIYAKAMPLDVACRVWDVFVRDGDEFLFRTALGILRMYQNELLAMDFVRCAQFLTKLPENIEASILFDNISQITTNIGGFAFEQMITQLSVGTDEL